VRAAVSVTTIVATGAARVIPSPNNSVPAVSPRNGVIAWAICRTVSSAAWVPALPSDAAPDLAARFSRSPK
jgi:hypothetical protein